MIAKIKSDFELLQSDGYVGYYKKCEIIEIFGFMKGAKYPFNIYTLVIFEDTNKKESETYLTESLEKFKEVKNIKWGIKRRIVDIKVANELFNDLLEDKNIEDFFEKIILLSKQYIQTSNTFLKPQINYILKNNFHNGSYIIEGFNNEKENLKFLLDNPVTLNDFSERVSDLIPIKIGNISDRLGNIIFQFPINLFKFKTTLLPSDQGFYLDFEYHKRLKEDLDLQIIVENTIDNSVLDSTSQKINGQNKILISTSDVVRYQIRKKKDDLIVYKNDFNTFKQMECNINARSPQDRIFLINNKKINVKITALQEEFGVGKTEKSYNNWIIDRKYDQELKELEKNLSFIQYFGKKNEDEKALDDIRFLIRKYGNQGVYIWDPYLSATDIKNTLYYSNIANINLKAITGLKQSKISNKKQRKQRKCRLSLSKIKCFSRFTHLRKYSTSKSKRSKKQTIDEMRCEFEKDDKNYLFLNLEVRGKIGNGGYGFHDRFLLFPTEQPKVWSLGTSVNQLGKSHHILQQVKNAQHILNAFNELWNELNSEECVVWKSM